MKKVILAVISMFLLAGALSEVKAQGYYYPRRRPRRVVQQQPPQPKPSIAIVGGVNVSNLIINNNAYNTTGTLAGFSGGLSLDLPFSYPFSFQPEVLYSGKGYSDITPDGQYTQRTNWIDVPLLLKIKLIPGFNFVVGPQISFLLSTQTTVNNGYTQSTTNVSNPPNNGYNSTLIGGVTGVSFDLSPNVELRARYAVDLQSTNVNGYATNNQVWQFGLGFKFR